MTGLPTLTPEGVVDTMRASSGHICFRHDGFGSGWTIRWNEARNGYEYLVTENDPQQDGDVIRVGIRVKEYIITPRQEMLAVLEDLLDHYEDMGADLGDLLHVVPYEDTNFRAAHRLADGPHEWLTGGEGEDRQHPDQITLTE